LVNSSAPGVVSGCVALESATSTVVWTGCSGTTSGDEEGFSPIKRIAARTVATIIVATAASVIHGGVDAEPCSDSLSRLIISCLFATLLTNSKQKTRQINDLKCYCPFLGRICEWVHL